MVSKYANGRVVNDITKPPKKRKILLSHLSTNTPTKGVTINILKPLTPIISPMVETFPPKWSINNGNKINE